MTNCLPRRDRHGHSFIEVMTAMVSATVLLAGLGGVMMISRQIAYAPTASNARLNSARVVNRLAEELRCAQWIIERSPDAIEFVVDDRDSDGDGERIRYELNGSDLERSVNGAEAIVVASDVQQFELTYDYTPSTERLYPVSDGAETILSSYPNTQGNSGRSISNQLWVSQQINPAGFSAIPAGATSWNATRVDFFGRRNGTNNTTLYMQLRSGGAPNNNPSSEVIGSAAVLDTTLSAGNSWNTVTFASPIRGLSLSQRYNLVWAGSNATSSCVLNYVDLAPDGGVAETSGSDVGAAWQYLSSRYIFYRLYGTYTTPGTPIDVTCSRVSSVNVVLRTDAASHSRIESSVHLENEPELLTSVWRADFEPDAPNPTTIDVDGDGQLDWAMASGTFNTNLVSSGAWTVSGALQSRPLNDFASVTHIDVRCRNGAVLRINADRVGNNHGPLIVRVTLANGKQTLTLSGETDASTERTLATVERLPNAWIRFRLLIVPQHDVVQLKVQDRVVGTFTYPTYNTNTTERFISLSGNGSQFDYVEAGVADGATVQLVN